MPLRPEFSTKIKEAIKNNSFTSDIMLGLALMPKCIDHVEKDGIELSPTQEMRSINFTWGDKIITAFLLDAKDGSKIWGCYSTIELQDGKTRSRYLGYSFNN
jgi:hypothetical protein